MDENSFQIGQFSAYASLKFNNAAAKIERKKIDKNYKFFNTFMGNIVHNIIGNNNKIFIRTEIPQMVHILYTVYIYIQTYNTVHSGITNNNSITMVCRLY